DLFHAEVGGQKVWPMIQDQQWLESTFIPTVQNRGKAINEGREKSSAASAANAAIDHVPDWVLGTQDGNWGWLGGPSDVSYGIPEGVIYGFPVTCAGGQYKIVQGLEISAFGRARMDATLKELDEEKEELKSLIAAT